MRVVSLNCGTMTPPLGGRIVCHVLLCETDDGLVLIDAGVGLLDCADPSRLGPFHRALRMALEPAEAAVRQVAALGYDPADVRHIVLTHLDLDHAGGLADFPHAVVHTTAREHHAAVVAPTLQERARYRKEQWAHGPRFTTYAGEGEEWLGLAEAFALEGLDDRFRLVPLPGHTRGHAAVAIDRGDRWLLHAGDAFFERASLRLPTDPPEDQRGRRTVLAYEQLVAINRGQVRDNHERLTELRRRGDVDVVCAHDPVQFERARAAV